MIPWIHSDFHASDDAGHMHISGEFARDDIRQQKVVLRDGLKVILYDADAADSGQSVWLTIPGTVRPGKNGEWVVELEYARKQHMAWNARPKVCTKFFPDTTG